MYLKRRHRSKVPKRWEKPKLLHRLTIKEGYRVMGYHTRVFQLGTVMSVDIRIKLSNYDKSDQFRDTFLKVKWDCDNKITRCAHGHVIMVNEVNYVCDITASPFIVLRNTTCLTKGDVYTWDNKVGIYKSALECLMSWQKYQMYLCPKEQQLPFIATL